VAAVEAARDPGHRLAALAAGKGLALLMRGELRPALASVNAATWASTHCPSVETRT
jgi:hypothetical protein